jgi:drug/metabolite transporter (DMT)-like permease
MSPLTGQPNHVRGILLIMAAVSTFAVLDTTAKYLSRSYPVPLIVWMRYALHMALMLVVLGPRLRWALVRTQRPGLQAFRGVVLAASSLFFFTGLAFMPIAEASAITYLAPLLMTAMSVYFLKERVRRSAWAALIGGLIGVLFIVRPGGAVFTPAVLLPLATAVCFATYQLLTRQLAGVDSTLATLFIGAAVGTAVVSVLLPFYWALPQTPFDAFLFVMLGVLGAVGHFVLIRAFEHAPPSVLAPFVYVQLVTVLVLGYLVFGDFPDGWSLVGMGIIVLSGAWIAARQGR